MTLQNAILELADDNLILGHRVSEWCGHAPILEEDLAMPNMSLDMIGTARTLYAYAADLEGQGRSEDDMAYLRDERGYLNCLLVERPNGDFATTMLRQLYFAAFMEPYWQAALNSTDDVVRGVAGKAAKEMAYHIRHSGEWVIRMGDGTDESAQRMKTAVTDLAPYIDELFQSSDAAKAAEEAGILPVRADMRAAWDKTINNIFAMAMVSAQDDAFAQKGGREGLHGEGLGHLLATMQSIARAHPGAVW